MSAVTPEKIGARMAGYLALRMPEAGDTGTVARLANAAFIAHNTGASVAGAVVPLLAGLAGELVDMLVRAALAAVDPGVLIETGRLEWVDERLTSNLDR